jgi:GntR family transcriptional regulator
MTLPAPSPLASPSPIGGEHGAGVTQYLQLASVLRHRITHGELQSGQQLPTVAQLATDYKLARVTVRQAYGVLAREGLITSQRGRGTFVSTLPSSGADPLLRNAINDPRARDIRFDILEQRRQQPLPEGLARGGATYPDYAFIRKIHVHGGEPFCLVEIHVASEIHALFPPDGEQHHKIAYLLDKYAADRMHKVQQTLTVAPADLLLAQFLHMSTLFDPVQAGDLKLANRIVMAPLTRNRAPNAIPTP